MICRRATLCTLFRLLAVVPALLALLLVGLPLAEHLDEAAREVEELEELELEAGEAGIPQQSERHAGGPPGIRAVGLPGAGIVVPRVRGREEVRLPIRAGVVVLAGPDVEEGRPRGPPRG